ncbi:MAG: OmpA family protein [Gammaproteobacteria bacterium]|nr:OmpA family protein [Gammaproteobacteria bacterium]
MRNRDIRLAGITLVVAVVLAGCSQYVKRDEFDSTMSDLRSKDENLQTQLDDMGELFSELTGQLNRKFEGYDAEIAAVQGRLRVEMTAHFGYDEADLREADKPALDQFTEVIREHHSNVVVTVEGFTDPAGDAKYNKWLGQQRANAVRDYLVNIGGLNGDKVRAVSYGEDTERLIKPGAWGTEGSANRRVALVIDYVAGI